MVCYKVDVSYDSSMTNLNVYGQNSRGYELEIFDCDLAKIRIVDIYCCNNSNSMKQSACSLYLMLMTVEHK